MSNLTTPIKLLHSFIWKGLLFKTVKWFFIFLLVSLKSICQVCRSKFYQYTLRWRYILENKIPPHDKPDIIEHEINTDEHAPIKQLPRRIPPHQREIIDQQLDELLANGRVEESQSAWSSPVVLVRKHDGSYCICIDYRKLNLCIEKDAIPLPRTNDVLEASGIWVLADASKRRGQTQNSVLDPSWTVPMEGYAIWSHKWAS